MRSGIIVGLTATALLAASLALATPTEMSVQVRNAQLRTTPSYLGQPAGTAAYGERVTVLSAQGDWRHVRTATTATGWIHASALSQKRITLNAGGQDVGTIASGEEMSLAGKGFNAQVEADFKTKNSGVDFGPIDRMEQIRIPTEEIVRFLREGGLTPTEGGAR